MKKSGLDHIDRYVGSRIRMRRVMLNISQTELATTLGMPSQQLHRYEKGINCIAAGQLQLIANSLEVPIEFFFAEERHAHAGAEARDAPGLDAVSNFLSSRNGVALIKAFLKIESPKLRRCVVELVEGIANEIANRRSASEKN